MFFKFRQNNSGGEFDTTMPYIMYVEVPTARVADAIAEDHGVYFNGCETGVDCECCGDRWSSAWEGEVTANPEVGDPAENGPVWVIRRDNTVTRYNYPDPHPLKAWALSEFKKGN